MRAAVLRDRNLVVDDVADPVAGPDQLLVRTRACGICGSDLHALRHGERMVELSRQSGAPFVMDLARDVVMGHEFSAEVVDVGPDAGGGFAPGDLVVSLPVVVGRSGVQAIGYSNDYPGGYGELMVLSPLVTLRVPNGLSFEQAALTEPLAVGRHAVNRAGLAPGAGAVVLGCGPIGLAVVADLSSRGVEPIVAADPSEGRRALASRLGAHAVVDPRSETAVDAWRRTASAAQAMVLFEAVGVPGMLDEAMAAAPRGTRIVVVGVCMEDDVVRPMLGNAKELDISFALAYDPAEFAGTLRSIAEGELAVAPLITGRVEVDGVPRAFRDLADPDLHCKILVEPA